jgi:radical SAM/Cys-rich protein
MSPILPSVLNPQRTDFEYRAGAALSGAARAENLGVLTLNTGLQCNLECEVCYHRSSPSRSECMPREVMLDALHFAAGVRPEMIEITGGEPVIWANLRECLTLASGMSTRVRVWTNLDALLSPEAADLPHFLAQHGIEVLASLPEALEGRTIGGCIEALKILSAAGYGDFDAGALPLDIAYTPLPGAMPGDYAAVNREFRLALSPHGVSFGTLVPIANMPLGGLADLLEEDGQTEPYDAMLQAAFNPEAIAGLPCRHGVTIAWDGSIWDCDYHLAAHVPLADGEQNVRDHVASQVGQLALGTRRISFKQHCFGCSARQTGAATP